MHRGDGEFSLPQLICKEVNLPVGAAVDDGLRDREALVEIAQRIQLPLLLQDDDVELLIHSLQWRMHCRAFPAD